MRIILSNIDLNPLGEKKLANDQTIGLFDFKIDTRIINQADEIIYDSGRGLESNRVLKTTSIM